MVRIITDSTSDISRARAEELGVEILPLTVNFGTEAYRDGVDLSAAAFYEKLAGVEELPNTSQVNPEAFINCFRPYIEAGDEVVAVLLSSELSGTYQSACIAREVLDSDRLFIVDSRTVTMGLGLVVEELCRLREGGMGAAALAAAGADLADRVRILAVVDTLKYLKMGGRISAATAVVGSLLGISPIIAVQGRNVESVGKARGRRAALRWIAEEIPNTPLDPTHGVLFGHTAAPDALAECREFFADWAAAAAFQGVSDIGCVVGTHVGPGATGIAFITKKPEDA